MKSLYFFEIGCPIVPATASSITQAGVQTRDAETEAGITRLTRGSQTNKPNRTQQVGVAREIRVPVVVTDADDTRGEYSRELESHIERTEQYKPNREEEMWKLMEYNLAKTATMESAHKAAT